MMSAAARAHSPALYGQIVKRIFGLAIPITFGSLIMPLITMIDLAVVPRQLAGSRFHRGKSDCFYTVS
jgi:Na+-driven multidrug efflux pump